MSDNLPSLLQRLKELEEAAVNLGVDLILAVREQSIEKSAEFNENHHRVARGIEIASSGISMSVHHLIVANEVRAAEAIHGRGTWRQQYELNRGQTVSAANLVRDLPTITMARAITAVSLYAAGRLD